VLHSDIDWELANCAGTDPAMYYSDGQGNGPSPLVYRVCGACEIRDDCYAWAVQENEYGVWGGHYFKDRDVLLNAEGGLHTADHGDGVPEVWSGDQPEMQSGERGLLERERDAVPASRHPSEGR